ncbi:hypothetical protein, partial [Pseudomonas sp. Irchel s3b2]|uniref:hypothetical protein n=1 Tax=Pseudomonas sp. Irchel s3b2 TaxID=2009073 RepID=UPI001C47B594
TAPPTPSGFDELKRNRCRKLRNSLFTKEFSVSTAPEVGRIIDFQNLPSTPDLIFLSGCSKSLLIYRCTCNECAVYCPTHKTTLSLATSDDATQ